MNMKVLIVDDEPPARARLKRLLEDIPGWEAIGEAANGRDALQQAEQLKPDLLLLDVRMPGIDGLETARHLAEWEQPPAVVFTTAYGDHALEAFDAQAVDYLLKPVRDERLALALQRAKSLTRAQANALALRDDDKPRARTHISAHYRGSMLLIPVDEIAFFQADSKYVMVRHLKGETLIDETLKGLEDEFDDRFLRVHRNALIAPRWVSGLDREGNVTFREIDDKVEISRANRAVVKKALASLSA